MDPSKFLIGLVQKTKTEVRTLQIFLSASVNLPKRRPEPGHDLFPRMFQDVWRALEGSRLAVIGPNGPYELQKTPPSASLVRLSMSPGPRDSPSLAVLEPRCPSTCLPLLGPVIFKELLPPSLPPAPLPRPTRDLSREPGDIGSLTKEALGERSAHLGPSRPHLGPCRAI